MVKAESHMTDPAQHSALWLPGKQGCPLIEPVILCHHLVRPGIAVAEATDDQENDRIDHVVVQGEHRASEQRMMDETYRDAEQNEIENEGRIGPPGLRTGLAGHPRRSSAEQAGDKEELPDRGFFVEDALH